ncbi:exo-beta-N-acetylmuramidase NamZ family protein [Fimbriimonas ginsengisoli]|uniref:YzbB n=1 Tax=Fimbriimonas ginsengisoli Gsoil 348 TaxID=661478 RepID=A0A068NUQ7_FIMGI|nr:DUF1343 domain-containing protein [Fimbriimonas ginsengisoli]AIE85349.1 YzbB [Fimbriimonas ginsengisoli Gsoil 348]
MPTATGLDVLAREGFSRLRGRRLGVLCNQASIDRDYRHLIDLLLPLHRAGELSIVAVFGPQHGLFGHTQDNMIEWEGDTDPRTGLTIHSLYGERRKPTKEMLEGIDLFVVDIPDIGSRYYTFAWTMANCIEASAAVGIPVLVLDRPNPIGGLQVEGLMLRSGFESFVGLYPVPTRHGMTAGEVATFVQRRLRPEPTLEVVKATGWTRSDYLEDADLPWAMPSPNMPTVDTAVVYPGGCLLEGTNLSEGRGTTRPFEIVGAPFLKGWPLAESLNRLALGGVHFRPVQFQPTFNKHAGRECEGVFVHVTDRRSFEPVITYIALLQEIVRQTGMHRLPVHTETAKSFVAASPECDLPGFAWKLPPYEYEFDRMPIDILAGDTWVREAIEGLSPLSEIRSRCLHECAEFAPERNSCLLY